MNQAEELMKLLDTTYQLIEFAAGYKARAMEAGFDEETANEMALCIHGEMAHKAFNQ